MEKLYDISEVCRKLETTSRTLRFYEDKGIIESTKTFPSSRRQYTEVQIAQIKNVMILRTLGLSVRAIKSLREQGTDLKTAIISKRAEIFALMDEKNRELHLLSEALALIESGRDIFENSPESLSEYGDPKREEIVRKCTDGVISGENTLYDFLSETMKEYMPPSAYEKMRADTLLPLGSFIRIDRLEYDRSYPNVIFHYVKYEKLGLKIKYVFHGEQIYGLWLGYYEPERKEEIE